MRVTKELLLEHGACESEVERFALLWPNGAETTYRNCLRASREKFDLEWFVDTLLDASRRKTYEEAKAPSRKTYKEAVATFRKTY